MGLPELKPNYRYEINVSKEDILKVLWELQEISARNYDLFCQNEEELADYLYDECDEELFNKFAEMTDVLEMKNDLTYETIEQIEELCRVPKSDGTRFDCD